MKKVTKFLSILLLVAMCMSLFGGSAYAFELDGNDSSSAPTAVNDGVQFGGDDAYLDGGSSSGGSTDLEISEEPTSGPILKAPVKPPVTSGGEAEINGTQYETLEKALAAAKSGDTIKFVNNITSNSPLTISTAVTIDLNDLTWNVNGGLTVNAAVTVTDESSAKNGQLYMNSVVNVNSTLTFKNIDLYADKGFSVSAYGKVEMKDVHSKGDYNFFKGMNSSQILIYSGTFEFNPAGFIVPGTIIEENNGAFIVKIDEASTYEASIDGKFYETLQAAFDAAYNGATVYVIQQTGDNKLSDAALNGSKNIILNLNNEEITAGNITVNTGSTLTIMNGWIDQSIENHGTLTVSGNAKVATLRVKGGAAYINGKVDTLNTDDGSTYMSDSNASIGEINVYSKPNLYISGGTVGSISENTTGAPKLVTGGTWGKEYVSGYVADGYEAVQERVGEWIVKAKGAAPAAPTPHSRHSDHATLSDGRTRERDNHS